MKATQLLHRQHREIEGILRALETEKGVPAVLLEKLADALVAHMAIEQALFYPALKKVDQQLVFQSLEEHAMAELELERLLDSDLSEPAFRAKVVVLAKMVLRHAEEEERVLFPKAEKALGAESLERLGTEMESMYIEAVEEGHQATLARSMGRLLVDEEINVMSPNFSGRPSTPSFA
ncbi:MAG: hemerythrin domain-containing protein [Polyangiales bacterium]